MLSGAGLLALVGLSMAPCHSTPPLPLAPPPASPRAARVATPETLFINFDGAVLQTGCGNDAHYDCSTLTAYFDGYVGPFPGNLNQKMAILQATRKAVADFGIRVVTQRPPDDTDYTMVLYGDLGPQTFAGVAPYIDCEDLIASDTSFTQAFASANTGSTVVLQEAAHTWGLEHVDNEGDILNPFKASSRTQRFLDSCNKIVADTDLAPTPGVCNQMHTRFCDAGFQNSYREMLHLFGPAQPDIEAPTLEITHPLDESTFVLPTTFALEGVIEDNLHPQFYTIEIWSGDDILYEGTSVSLSLLLQKPQAGEYDLRVVISDEGGNRAEDRVRFTVLPEGSQLPASEREDVSSTGSATACRTAPSPGTTLLPWLAFAFAGLSRRRHHAC